MEEYNNAENFNQNINNMEMCGEKRTWEARQLKRRRGRAFPFFYLVWGGEGDNWIAEQRTPVKYDSPGHTHHHQPSLPDDDGGCAGYSANSYPMEIWGKNSVESSFFYYEKIKFLRFAKFHRWEPTRAVESDFKKSNKSRMISIRFYPTFNM